MITIPDAVKYEVAASGWWTGFIASPWLQDRIGAYFAWKVRRKHARYMHIWHKGSSFILK